MPPPSLGNEPPPPPPTGRLPEEEVSYILDTTLIPEHRKDPNILRFISEYMRVRHPEQAAEAAGLQRRSGRNLLSRPDIYKAICTLGDKSMRQYGYDAAEIIERVKEVSGFDPVEIFDESGAFKNIHDIPPEVRRVIKKMKVKNTYAKDQNGIEYNDGQILEIEFLDKMEAHRLLGKQKDVFVEKSKVTHDVTENMANVLLGGLNRGAQRYEELNNAIDVTPARPLLNSGEEK